MRHHPRVLAAACACLLLAACSADQTATPSQAAGEDSLPKPDAAAGSVTGMPNPGTPSAIPRPVDDLVTDGEDPNADYEDVSPFDPNLPVDPEPVGINGEVATPPPETMPTVPAPTPDPVESSVTPPPES